MMRVSVWWSDRERIWHAVLSPSIIRPPRDAVVVLVDTEDRKRALTEAIKRVEEA